MLIKEINPEEKQEELGEVKKIKGGQIMNKIIYEIIYNTYQKKYVVFKNIEGCFNFKGIFSAERKKDCIEWLKEYKGKEL